MCRSLCLHMGGLRPPPTRCFKAIHASNKEETSCHHHVCRKGKLCRSLCLHMGGLRPPQPAVLKPSMLPIKKKHHVITMFAGKESCADHYVCTWGGCAPPTRCFKAIHASNKEETSCHHHVCRKGSLYHYVWKWGGLPPQPPAASKPSMSAITKKHHVIARFVAKEGCAAYVVRRPIFSENILNHIRTVSREWNFLKTVLIESTMEW